MYIYEGSCVITTGSDTQEIAAPQILFFPPNFAHGITHVLSERLVTLDIKFSIQDVSALTTLSIIPVVSVPRDEQPKYLLEQIRNEGFQRQYGYQNVCAHQLSLLLLMLLRWHTEIDTTSLHPHADTIEMKTERESNPLTSGIIEFLQEHYMKTLTSDQLEHQFNYSYRYISSVFRHDMQMTPMAYQKQIRIARAQDLLSYTQFELKEIAQVIGYSSVHEFSRHFKTQVGIPPGKWRENSQHHIREDVCINPEFINELYVDKQEI
jgi:AraC-like DNA-binding protein